VVNHSPEPVSNWIASIGEDVMAPAIVWISWAAPVFLLIALVLFILFALWLVPKLWRLIRKVLRLARSGLGNA
jgi:hypothetical protein